MTERVDPQTAALSARAGDLHKSFMYAGRISVFSSSNIKYSMRGST